MTLQVASTSSECCITVVSSMTDKAVSTDDLPSYSPQPANMNQRTTMSSVVANELLRLEAALNAVMQATSPTEDEIPVVSIRRPRSHSHHHCLAAAVHPRRSRRSASAIVLQNHQSPYHMCRHHGPASPGPSTISSCDGYSRGRINSDHLCLPVNELELQGPLVSRDNSGKRRRKKKRKRKNSKTITKIKDPEELPKRARWTIVITACMLLFMCFLLVGITLRMAPIIDEMVRKENQELQNQLNRVGDEVAISMIANLSSPGINTVTDGIETSVTSATDTSSESTSASTQQNITSPTTTPP